MAQGEVPCDLEMAMGKNIRIAIYTWIFMHMAMGGIYRLWENIHIAMYYLNEKPDFKGAQGVV